MCCQWFQTQAHLVLQFQAVLCHQSMNGAKVFRSCQGLAGLHSGGLEELSYGYADYVLEEYCAGLVSDDV